MEPVSVAQHAFELWGPVGGLVVMVMIGGFMALKWLANRDDARNVKMLELAERVATAAESCKTALINNTAAMQNLTNSHDELRDAVLERSRPRVVKMNGRARA